MRSILYTSPYPTGFPPVRFPARQPTLYFRAPVCVSGALCFEPVSRLPLPGVLCGLIIRREVQLSDPTTGRGQLTHNRHALKNTSTQHRGRLESPGPHTPRRLQGAGPHCCGFLTDDLFWGSCDQTLLALPPDARL